MHQGATYKLSTAISVPLHHHDPPPGPSDHFPDPIYHFLCVPEKEDMLYLSGIFFMIYVQRKIIVKLNIEDYHIHITTRRVGEVEKWKQNFAEELKLL